MMRLIIFLLLTVIIASCNQPDTSSDEVQEQQPEQVLTNNEDKVQALLLIQDKSFSKADEKVVDTEYTLRQKIAVPSDLGSQNKWVMFEGPILENELIAYRFYMDSRHRFDIYGKRTNDLVMDTVGWDYHEIMDWGSDILKVGNSLGMGSPAIYLDGEVITFSDYEQQTVTITKDNNETACITTLFEGLKIGNQSIDLQEEWCLSAGSPLTTMILTVVEGNLPEGARWATGIVKHLDDYTLAESEEMAYLYTWGKQSFHEEMMGMTVLVNKHSSYAYTPNDETHLLTVAPDGDTFTYQFGAAWERDVTGIKNSADFEQLLKSK
jgi:hypothetical protein